MPHSQIDNSVRLVPYRAFLERDRYIVEHLSTGEFFEMPHPAIDAMEALEKGIHPDEVEMMLKSRYPEEDINIKDFLSQLQQLGFIASSCTNDVQGHSVGIDNKHSLLGKLLFNNRILFLYGLFFTANVMFFLLRPDLFPHYRDLFPFPSMAVNVLTALIVSFLLLIIHECGHVLAIRAHGLPAKVRIGHRLFLVVMETEMNYIWRLNRRQRNVPYLAGLCFDHTLLMLSLLTLMSVSILPFYVEAVLGIVVFHLLVMSVYQCMFFMKTDLYYVFQNITGCHNLMENALDWLKRRMPFVHQRTDSIVFKGEERIVKGYAFLVFVGVIISLTVFLLYFLPQFVYIAETSLYRLFNPSSAAMAWDAVIILLQGALMIGLLLYSWIRKYALRKA